MCGRFTQHYTWSEVHAFLRARQLNLPPWRRRCRQPSPAPVPRRKLRKRTAPAGSPTHDLHPLQATSLANKIIGIHPIVNVISKHYCRVR
jgi:hypothetical protein